MTARYCWSDDEERFVGGFDTIEEAACEALDCMDDEDFRAGVEVERWIGEVGPPMEDPDPEDGLEYEVLRPRRLVVTSFDHDAAGTRIGYRFDDGATGVAEWVIAAKGGAT